MNTYMSRKQAVVQQPPLRRMLSHEYIRIYHRYALRRWRSEPTDRIVRRCRPVNWSPSGSPSTGSCGKAIFDSCWKNAASTSTASPGAIRRARNG